MRVAVTSSGRELNSPMDDRFGRCKYFIFVNPETSEYEVVENSGTGSSGGAGVQAAQLVADHGADVLITGHVGPNAMQALQAVGLEIFTTGSCSILEAVDHFTQQQLEAVRHATVEPHFGVRGQSQ